MKVFGIVGTKNSGKTTLTALLVKHLSARGFTVSTAKHSHHSFDIDHQGTDTYQHREAGAKEVLISSSKRWALMHETQHPLSNEDEPCLEQLIANLSPVDLLLVEGFKQANHPKLQCLRKGIADDLLTDDTSSLSASNIIALASDSPEDFSQQSLPVFNVDNINTIADFIINYHS